MKDIAKLVTRAELLVARLQEAQAAKGLLIQRQRELEAAGMEDAAPYWNDKGYLYIVGRMRKGERGRRYVGKDQVKVKEELAKIERFKEHEKVSKSLSDLENTTYRIEYSLSEAHSALSAVALPANKVNS